MLYKDAEDYFNEFSSELPIICTDEKGHGQIKKCEYYLLTDISWLEQKQEWSGLNDLGMVRSTVTEGDETRVFTRYFITSLIDLNEFSCDARKYWSIENQLHWCLDVIFREDASGARKDNFPLNMNVMRKTAVFLVTQVQYRCISKKKNDV